MNANYRKHEGLLALAGILVSLVAAAGGEFIQPVSIIDSNQPRASGGNGDSTTPILSPDGRYVLFASTANNLMVLNETNAIATLVPARLNAFCRDRIAQTTRLISLNTNASGGGNGDSFPVDISTNGQLVLFESSASNLVPGDTNQAADVFLRDLVSGTTALVSVNTNGGPGNAASRSAVMTPDGRFVAFVSEANDLVPNDTNKIADVFVRDLQTLTTTLVSLGAVSTNSTATMPSSSSESPQITPDGRFIAFSSTATNLVPGVRLAGDIYVYDRMAGTNLWASSGMREKLQTATGKTNGICYNLALCADGRFVAYQASVMPLSTTTNSGLILRYSLETGSTDLIHTNGTTSLPAATDTGNLSLTPDGQFVAFVANTNGLSGSTTSIQVWDAGSGLITLVSGDPGGNIPTNSFSTRPVIDPSGRYVAFLSNATNLTSNALTGPWHLYVRDLLTATTTLVDADTNGVGSLVPFTAVPSLSADGRLVAFECADGGLVPNDNNRNQDVFVRDLVAATNELISLAPPALASVTPNSFSLLSAFPASTDGRFVAFASDADNLAPDDTNGFRDVFVRDLAGGTVLRISAAPDGSSANGISTEPVLSGNGRYVAFTSSATNLVAGDTNAATDVFVRDLQTGATALASGNFSGSAPGNKASSSPTLSADGRWLLFQSQATDLTVGSFTAGTENLFLRDRQAGTNRALTTAGVTSAAMTPDGRFVAFVGKIPGVSTAYLYVWDTSLNALVFTNSTTGITQAAISANGNLVAYNGPFDLRLADRAANTDWAVNSLGASFLPPPRFSADGNWLVYVRLVSSFLQTYLYDIAGRTELLVSHAPNSSAGGNGHSDFPDVSPGGRFVSFRTMATNLVPGTSGLIRQILLYDRQTGSNTLVSANRFTGGPADDHSQRASFSPDGQTLFLQSWDANLVAGDFNRSGDVMARSIFTAVILPPVTGQGTWLYWPFVPGNNYRVQFKNDLADPLWQDLPGNVTNIGVKAWRQDTAPANPQRWYRVLSN